MNRHVLLAASALGLSACGAGVTAPVEAPGGVAPLVAEFVEVCGRAVGEIDAGLAHAQALGWSDADTMTVPSQLGRLAAMSKGAATLSVNDLNFTHVSGVDCQVTVSGVIEDAGFSRLNDIPGYDGGWYPIPGGGGAGRWSQRAGGEVLAMSVNTDGQSLTFMGLSRRVLK